MNPLELYKKLPKKNCGKCRQKTCMPFALAIIKGDADLSDCPDLTGDEIEALKGSVTASDWREELILKLREEVKTIKFQDVAGGLGIILKDNALVLNCMGREFSISPDGEITTSGHITPWIKILLLHYVRTAGKEDLTDKWSSYSELKAGLVKASSFERDCEIPLRELFDKDLSKVEMVLNRLGAEKREDFPTKNAWHLSLLPKVPVIILYWPEEDGFPSKVKILFDSTADRFLDAESLIFLLEGLVKNVEHSY